MTAATATAIRSAPDWAGLASAYQQAAASDLLDKFRRQRWGGAAAAAWLQPEYLPSLTEPQALTLYRTAGGRRAAEFRSNAIADVRDAIDFLLYDTIKLESRFDECAAPDGGFGLAGAGREWPSFLLAQREPTLFAPWRPHTERGLRRLGLFPPRLKQGHVGLCYLELLDILEYVRARLHLPDLRAVDEFCYLTGRPAERQPAV